MFESMGIVTTVIFFTLVAFVLLFTVEAFAKNVLNKRLLPPMWMDWFYNGLVTNKWFWIGFIAFIVMIVIFNP